MTASMTAFASQESHHSWGSLTWEIRSVNQRYLEPHLRLPETLRSLEPLVRSQLRQELSRGKLDINLKLVTNAENEDLAVNTELLDQLIAAADQIYARTPAASLDPLRLLQWPGLIQSAQPDIEAIKQAALVLFEQTLNELKQHRLREGKQLAKLIEQRLEQIGVHLNQAQNLVPEALKVWRENLHSKAQQLGVELDPTRLEQEILLLAQKADVAEELDRLETHIKEVHHALKSQEPIGRRLDFLMQEMNREANTLGSKAVSLAMTQLAVDLKVLIEQMREQVQNIE